MNIGLGAARRTILLIDADAHARAGLRKALEAARFSVGEAASAAEGERTARRIHPDAILEELAHDESHGAMPTGPIAAFAGAPRYILSAAADALAGSVSLRELGVAGVFLKPADASLVIRVLQTRLGVLPGADGHA